MLHQAQVGIQCPRDQFPTFKHGMQLQAVSANTFKWDASEVPIPSNRHAPSFSTMR